MGCWQSADSLIGTHVSSSTVMVTLDIVFTVSELSTTLPIRCRFCFFADLVFDFGAGNGVVPFQELVRSGGLARFEEAFSSEVPCSSEVPPDTPFGEAIFSVICPSTTDFP